MKQPIFYPGKKLCAEDLIGLEEYAFSRTNIISPDHGVVNLFNNGLQPEQRQDRDLFYFIIKEVTGITPAGRPVNFKASSTRMPLKIEFPSVGIGIWDIYIDDEHPDGTEPVDESREKYSLSKVPITSPETEIPSIIDNKLYLGRYKLMKDAPPKIISPPYIYSLSSFNFPSDEWQSWTFPIRDALRRVVQKYKSEPLFVFIKNLIYNYPFWPLSQLLKACNQLSWLSSESNLEEILDEGRMADLQFNLLNGSLIKSVYNISPNEIPTKIAELIGGGSNKIWNLVTQQQLTIENRTILIEKSFLGVQEIKFRFKPGIEIQEYARIRVNNFYTYEAPRFTEPDNLNNVCYCFMIEYQNTLGDQKFSMILPNGWKVNDFTIYYRMKTPESNIL